MSPHVTFCLCKSNRVARHGQTAGGGQPLVRLRVSYMAKEGRDFEPTFFEKVRTPLRCAEFGPQGPHHLEGTCQPPDSQGWGTRPLLAHGRYLHTAATRTRTLLCDQWRALVARASRSFRQQHLLRGLLVAEEGLAVAFEADKVTTARKRKDKEYL